MSELADLVTRIVEVEQPIHAEEVGRRLALCCGWQRAGSVIQDCAHRGLTAAKRKGRLHREGDFWFMSDENDVVARDRSHLAATETVRKVEMISPVEIAAAVVHALEENMALSLDEVVVEAARVLGFARVGKDIHAAVRQAITSELPDQLAEDHLGRLRLAE